MQVIKEKAAARQKISTRQKKRFIPFDYGHLAFIYDSEKIKNPPHSLKDLTDKRFRKKIVIESPVSSAPGLSFLHWTILQFGEKGFVDYWQKLSPNLINITSGWSAAYGMFVKGETPIGAMSRALPKIVEIFCLAAGSFFLYNANKSKFFNLARCVSFKPSKISALLNLFLLLFCSKRKRAKSCPVSSKAIILSLQLHFFSKRGKTLGPGPHSELKEL